VLDPREEHHEWATEALLTASQPWLTCEAVFSEALFLLQVPHARALLKLVRCGQLQIAFNLADQVEEVLDLLDKYNDTPMSVADACLVRMSELVADPLVTTTDADFLVYRRHGRQSIPCLMP
jgi:predicted nucleic acid-binding protein